MKKRHLFLLLVIGLVASSVSCEKDPETKTETETKIFEVDNTSLTFAAAAADRQTIAVDAENVLYGATVDDAASDWLSFEKIDAGLSVAVTPNETVEVRTGTITVTADDPEFDPVVVSVSQDGTEIVVTPVFEVDAEPLAFAASPEGVQTIAVTVEHLTWSYEVSDDGQGWLTAEKIEAGLSVTATANESTEARTAQITITPENADFEPVVVAISQVGKEEQKPELPDEVDFDMVFEAFYYGDDFAKGAGGGRFEVTFMNITDVENALFESFTLEGFIPTAPDETIPAIALPTGDYAYELAETFTGAPFTFLSYYGEVRDGGSRYLSTLNGTDNEDQLFFAVEGGTVTVSDAGYGNITVEANVVDGSGETMKLTYTGPLSLKNTLAESGNKDYNTEFTVCSSAQHIGQYFEQPVREFEFIFTKQTTNGPEVVNETLRLRFNADIGASPDKFPAGMYLPFTTVQYAPRAPMTYMRGGSSWGVIAGSYYTRSSNLYEEETVFLDQDDGYIEVTDNGNDNYTFAVRSSGTSVTSEGTGISTVAFDFTGQIIIN